MLGEPQAMPVSGVWPQVEAEGKRKRPAPLGAWSSRRDSRGQWPSWHDLEGPQEEKERENITLVTLVIFLCTWAHEPKPLRLGVSGFFRSPFMFHETKSLG